MWYFQLESVILENSTSETKPEKKRKKSKKDKKAANKDEKKQVSIDYSAIATQPIIACRSHKQFVVHRCRFWSYTVL